MTVAGKKTLPASLRANGGFGGNSSGNPLRSCLKLRGASKNSVAVVAAANGKANTEKESGESDKATKYAPEPSLESYRLSVVSYRTYTPAKKLVSLSGRQSRKFSLLLRVKDSIDWLRNRSTNYSFRATERRESERRSTSPPNSVSGETTSNRERSRRSRPRYGMCTQKNPPREL